MRLVSHKMYVMDHMKEGSGLLMFVVVLVLFPCCATLNLFFLRMSVLPDACLCSQTHVCAPRHKTDIVRERMPGLSNMLRQKTTEGGIFSGLHVQMILFSLFTHTSSSVNFLDVFAGKSCGKVGGNLAGFSLGPTYERPSPNNLGGRFGANVS